jgi:WD40 repeat protein
MKGKERVSGGYLLIVWALMAAAVCARDIAPFFQLTASGLVNDFVVDEGVLYVATDQGSIDIFDLRRRKIIDRIVLKPTLTAKGESVPTAILSVDRMKGKTLFVSSGSGNYRDIWIYEGFELKRVKRAEEKIFAKKARFAHNGRIVLGTMGSDVILYDPDEGYRLYREHVSQSALGGMVLGDGKRTVAMADESGAVRLIDIDTGRVKKEFPPQNLDNVYSVAYRGGVLLTGGEDRRVGVYPAAGNPYHLRSDFLVYAVALSPSGEQGVYSSGTEQALQLFDICTRAKGDRLVGHRGIVHKIVFLGEKMLISAGNEQEIFIWKLD